MHQREGYGPSYVYELHPAMSTCAVHAVQVIDTCHAVGISKKCVRLKPIVVVKG
jgi:hypothetical protein